MVFATGQVIKPENVPNDFVLFIAYARGVSENIDYAINGTAAETVALAISGINNYFSRLISTVDDLQDLWGDEIDEFIDFQFVLKQNYEEFSSIYAKYYNSGKQLTLEDQQFLETVKNSFDLLLDAMQQKEGDVNPKIISKEYFSKVISDFLMSAR